jgi:hypothetical protein
MEEPVARLETGAGALALSVPLAFFEVSVRPGATADTSAAKPAVSAAAPAITQRRVWLTRANAASRIMAARDRSEPRYSFAIFGSNYRERESARCKSSMRIPYRAAA